MKWGWEERRAEWVPVKSPNLPPDSSLIRPLQGSTICSWSVERNMHVPVLSEVVLCATSARSSPKTRGPHSMNTSGWRSTNHSNSHLNATS